MKLLKVYLTPNDIKERIVNKTDKTEVIFTKAEIDRDGFVNIECLVTEDQFEENPSNTRRTHLSNK